MIATGQHPSPSALLSSYKTCLCRHNAAQPQDTKKGHVCLRRWLLHRTRREAGNYKDTTLPRHSLYSEHRNAKSERAHPYRHQRGGRPHTSIFSYPNYQRPGRGRVLEHDDNRRSPASHSNSASATWTSRSRCRSAAFGGGITANGHPCCWYSLWCRFPRGAWAAGKNLGLLGSHLLEWLDGSVRSASSDRPSLTWTCSAFFSRSAFELVEESIQRFPKGAHVRTQGRILRLSEGLLEVEVVQQQFVQYRRPIKPMPKKAKNPESLPPEKNTHDKMDPKIEQEQTHTSDPSYVCSIQLSYSPLTPSLPAPSSWVTNSLIDTHARSPSAFSLFASRIGVLVGIVAQLLPLRRLL